MLLSSACPLDLNAMRFPPGMCTRTVFAKAEIVLWRTAATVFRVEVGRSFAAYFSGLLAQAIEDGAFSTRRP
jgi:sarcosine oxidase subunit gamma